MIVRFSLPTYHTSFHPLRSHPFGDISHSMGRITTWYKQTRSYLAKEIRVFSAAETTPLPDMPFIPNWVNSARLGIPRGINLIELRQFAKSAWVQMVVNSISKQIMTTEWDIVTANEEDDLEAMKADVERVKTFLKQPNRNGDTFWDVWVPFVRDVLELDAGIVYKGRNAAGKLVEIFAYDGGRFLVNMNEHGIVGEDSLGNEVPGYYQYSFRNVSNPPVPFDKDEIVYGRMNTNTELFPYGFSPLQSIQQEVELMIQSTRFNKERFANNTIPDGIVNVPMPAEELNTFKNSWEQTVRGRPHKLVFLNSPDAKFTPLAMSNKDMEWLDGQKWYFHVVFAAFGLSPQEVGFFENSNRSTSESQERVSIKNAVKPYLDLIAAKINREIIYELVGHDKLEFKWFPKDHVAEKIEHDQQMAQLDAGVITINEVRGMKGLEDVPWGDEPLQAPSPAEPSSEPESAGEPKPRDESSEEAEEEARKLYTKLFKGFMINGKQ